VVFVIYALIMES